MSQKSPDREFEILAMVDLPAIDPDRRGKTDVFVTYRLGPYQSGQVRVPKESFTEKKMLEAVRKDIETKAKYVGKKFKV